MQFPIPFTGSISMTETKENYKVWDEVKQRCYIRHDLVFNEEDFGNESEKTNEDMVIVSRSQTIPQPTVIWVDGGEGSGRLTWIHLFKG